MVARTIGRVETPPYLGRTFANIIHLWLRGQQLVTAWRSLVGYTSNHSHPCIKEGPYLPLSKHECEWIGAFLCVHLCNLWPGGVLNICCLVIFYSCEFWWKEFTDSVLKRTTAGVYPANVSSSHW